MGAVECRWEQWSADGSSGIEMGAVECRWEQWDRDGSSGIEMGAVDTDGRGSSNVVPRGTH